MPDYFYENIVSFLPRFVKDDHNLVLQTNFQVIKDKL